jgi:CDP-paratose 2-epimerase
MPHNVDGGPALSRSLAELTLECQARVGRTIDIAGDPVDRPCDVPYYVTDSGAVAGRSGWRPQCWKS